MILVQKYLLKAGAKVVAKGGTAAYKGVKERREEADTAPVKSRGREADEGYNTVKNKTTKSAGAKQEENRCQELCRTRGWKYQRLVVDQDRRWVVFNDRKQPMAAFPPVESAKTPAALAARFESTATRRPTTTSCRRLARRNAASSVDTRGTTLGGLDARTAGSER